MIDWIGMNGDHLLQAPGLSKVFHVPAKTVFWVFKIFFQIQGTSLETGTEEVCYFVTTYD
jgi:hypothetical protein